MIVSIRLTGGSSDDALAGPNDEHKDLSIVVHAEQIAFYLPSDVVDNLTVIAMANGSRLFVNESVGEIERLIQQERSKTASIEGYQHEIGRGWGREQR